MAALRNKAGKFVYPNLENIKAAASVIKRVPASNEMHIVNPPKSVPKAYPLSTFTYCIVPTVSPKKPLLAKLVLYAASTGQKFGPALDFSPLPKVVYNAAVSTVGKITQG